MTDEIRGLRAQVATLTSELETTQGELISARRELALHQLPVELNEDQGKAIAHLADRDQDWTQEALMKHCEVLGWVEPGDTADDIEHVPGAPGSAAYRFIEAQ